ncbi:hypothetical protein NDA13_003254 [Ustilago tritici]|nr:hypothetical protein NDA13_003254 [Ustilago tritici]
MKLTPSLVLALAAAAGATASPVYRRQAGGAGSAASTATGSLPIPSAVSAISSAVGGPASAPGGPMSSTASAPQPSGTGAAGAGAGSGPAAAPNATSPSGGSDTRFNDTQILQYALTLEHLEANFYNQSLSKLSASDFEQAGYNASVRNQIYSIGRDEVSHVELLTTALGENAVPACTYNFSSVTDVPSFLATARVLEGVGVSAYLGASKNLTNQTVETAASILVVEGQHQSYLIAQTDDGGNAIPSPYATPLNFKQVYSLAAPFIESCPENATLPITTFPALTLASASGENNGTFTPGQQVNVTYDSSNGTSSSGNKYLAVIQGIAGPQFLPLDSGSNSSSTVTLPANLTGGQMYAVVTSSDSSVTDDNTLAGPAVGYVSVPLPEAPDATNTSFSSSSSASATATDSGATGGAGAAPTPTDGVSSASGAAATATANGSDSIVSTESSSATGSASASDASSTSQGLAPSLANLGSAKLPTPTP